MKPVILTYHSVDASGSVISIAPQQFRAQMRFLATFRIPVVPLSAIGKTPGAVALTFDDGFENFYTEAFPVLQEYHFPATVFAVSGYCGASNQWPSQPAGAGIPSLPLMDWAQLTEISRHGITLGAHTVTHPHLDQLPEPQVRSELVRCREMIQQRTGQAVEELAYPYGDSNPSVRGIAAEYFRAAYGTRPAFLTGASDSMNLPRVDVYYLRNRLWFESMQEVHGRWYVATRRSLRAVRNMAGATFSARAAG